MDRQNQYLLLYNTQVASHDFARNFDKETQFLKFIGTNTKKYIMMAVKILSK